MIIHGHVFENDSTIQLGIISKLTDAPKNVIFSSGGRGLVI
jgi:hypothetical protein